MILMGSDGLKSVELKCKKCYQVFVCVLAFNEKDDLQVAQRLAGKVPAEYACPHGCGGQVEVHVRPGKTKK